MDPYTADAKFGKKWGYGCEWIGSPSVIARPESLERAIVRRRNDIVVLGTVSDDSDSYSYDIWALVSLDGEYYLLQTSGCSCPSPSETWSVESGPFATVAAVRERIMGDQYNGWTIQHRQLANFIEMLDAAEAGEQKVLVH